MIGRFGVTSVLDLGSGCGNASLYFYKRGLQVLAVDGFPDNVLQSLYPAIEHDITKSAVLTNVDLVHCQEVVEHISEAYLDNLLASLLTGKIVLMTHALPGQLGHHHVNLQVPEYWISHIEARGGAFLEEDSNRIRKLAAHDGAIYMERTGLVFSNTNRL
jgi:SAM-dependent methyltransferase